MYIGVPDGYTDFRISTWVWVKVFGFAKLLGPCRGKTEINNNRIHGGNGKG
jgi:hypothetical protein